jgi:hypothetical protein
MSKYFIAVYTNKVKSYCDGQFFARLDEIKGDNYIGIVDNTVGNDYLKRLFKITGENVYKINVPSEPKRTQFLRNVEASVNSLRDDFLQRDEKYFLIIESDVLPPYDLLDLLDEDIETLETGYRTRTYDWFEDETIRRNSIPKVEKPWGAIGALYYSGFHDYEKKGLQPTHHTLSGCTVYKREAVEKYPFRWSSDNLDAFPDAWWSYDAGQQYSLWNDHDIHCDHLHSKNGTRQEGVL